MQRSCVKNAELSVVMPALVAGIRALFPRYGKDVDGRDEMQRPLPGSRIVERPMAQKLTG
jgi:hypothetical protein